MAEVDYTMTKDYFEDKDHLKEDRMIYASFKLLWESTGVWLLMPRLATMVIIVSLRFWIIGPSVTFVSTYFIVFVDFFDGTIVIVAISILLVCFGKYWIASVRKVLRLSSHPLPKPHVPYYHVWAALNYSLFQSTHPRNLPKGLKKRSRKKICQRLGKDIQNGEMRTRNHQRNNRKEVFPMLQRFNWACLFRIIIFVPSSKVAKCYFTIDINDRAAAFK